MKRTGKKITNPRTEKSVGQDLRDEFEKGFESPAFSKDFKEFSVNYQDNETRAPGIDNDYATTEGGTQAWIGLRALDKSADVQEVIPTPAHPGKSPRAVNSADDRLREGIYSALTDEKKLDATDIDIEVEGGIARITGSVPEEEMRSDIENIALGIPGVENVYNYLTTRRRVARGPSERSRESRR